MSEQLKGTLLRGIGSFYTVADENGNEHTLRCRKKCRYLKMTPMAGDQVLFTPDEGENHGWLEEILPRRSACVRPPVANAEMLLVVTAPEPEPDLLLADKLILQAFRQNMNVLLVVNKSELDPALAERIKRQYRESGIAVFAVSAKTGEGIDDLRSAMRGSLCCMTGQSGVGKSTLLNVLMGLELETGEISRKILRGRNTTRCAELLIRNGLRVFDTAGFSLLDTVFEPVDPVELKEYWPEFSQYEGYCRFDSCCHDREPGCAVTAACDAGAIAPERLERYRQLLRDARQIWRERYD